MLFKTQEAASQEAGEVTKMLRNKRQRRRRGEHEALAPELQRVPAGEGG